MEASAMQESTILIDDSSEAYAERLELCVLRSAAFTADGPEFPGCLFFAEAFRILESKRTGNDIPTGMPGGNSIHAGKFTGQKELCKLENFWTEELNGLLPLTEGGALQDLVIAWETTLQLLFEAESANAEGRPAGEKEMKDILYSYHYDYAEEFLLRDETARKEGKKTPRRFVTELARISLAGNGGALSAHAMEGIRLFFGDRLKARLLEAMEKCQMKSETSVPGIPVGPEDSGSSVIPGIPGMGAHQKKTLAEFFEKAALFSMLAVLLFVLCACGKKTGEEETAAMETETADSYPGVVSYQSEDGTVNDRFGIMHAMVLDVQKGEKDGLYVYTLRDEEDPENAWCLYSQDIGSIVAEMSGGKKVAVLFSGDIVNDPDHVEFIAILNDAPYTIKKISGTTVANMMNSFTVRTGKGEELNFIKDNCKVDRDALSTDDSARVLIFYADGGGDKYPLRVYKSADSRHD